jgi:hypothetical protein
MRSIAHWRFLAPLLALVASPLAAPSAWASGAPGQPAAPPLKGALQPDAGAKPALPAPKREAQWPKTVPEARAEKAAGESPPAVWSPEEIVAASAACKALLSGVDAVVVPVEPFRHGSCGAPAAVQLISVGRNPEVALSPPVTVTCPVVAAFAKWMEKDVQPAARALLGAPVIRVETMSSYSCRNAYGRTTTRLSEHGRANAIDVARFTTASGLASDVLDHWGVTEREERVKMAAARAEERARRAAAQAAQRQVAPEPASGQVRQATIPPAAPPAAATATLASPQPAQPAVVAPPATAPSTTPNLLSGIPSFAARLPGLALPGSRDSGLGFAPASRLGGPKPEASTAPGPRHGEFLRRVHAAACGTFLTVLGPLANAAHENHFHLDMASRASGSFCE